MAVRKASYAEILDNVVGKLSQLAGLIDLSGPSEAADAPSPTTDAQKSGLTKSLSESLSATVKILEEEIQKLRQKLASYEEGCTREDNDAVLPTFVISQGRWNENTIMCETCEEEFTLFTRPHHCRTCGKCVCSTCSTSRLGTGESNPVRVCNDCVKSLISSNEQMRNPPPADGRASQTSAVNPTWNAHQSHNALGTERPLQRLSAFLEESPLSQSALVTESLSVEQSHNQGSAVPPQSHNNGATVRTTSPVKEEPSPALSGMASEAWSVEQTHNLGSAVPETGLQVLDRQTWTSVQSAAHGLNHGTITCEEGMCITYSSSFNSYFLMYRNDRAAEASRRFGFEVLGAIVSGNAG